MVSSSGVACRTGEVLARPVNGPISRGQVRTTPTGFVDMAPYPSICCTHQKEGQTTHVILATERAKPKSTAARAHPAGASGHTRASQSTRDIHGVCLGREQGRTPSIWPSSSSVLVAFTVPRSARPPRPGGTGVLALEADLRPTTFTGCRGVRSPAARDRRWKTSVRVLADMQGAAHGVDIFARCREGRCVRRPRYVQCPVEGCKKVSKRKVSRQKCPPSRKILSPSDSAIGRSRPLIGSKPVTDNQSGFFAKSALFQFQIILVFCAIQSADATAILRRQRRWKRRRSAPLALGGASLGARHGETPLGPATRIPAYTPAPRCWGPSRAGSHEPVNLPRECSARACGCHC
jgi:hypothetical protein